MMIIHRNNKKLQAEYSKWCELHHVNMTYDAWLERMLVKERRKVKSLEKKLEKPKREHSPKPRIIKMKELIKNWLIKQKFMVKTEEINKAADLIQEFLDYCNEKGIHFEQEIYKQRS